MAEQKLEVKKVESRWEVALRDTVYGRYDSEVEALSAAKDWEEYYNGEFLS